MAGDMHKLLDHIVRTLLVHEELVAIDQEASANEPGATIESDKKRAERRELDLASELAKAFGQGISRAQSGQTVLDDRNAEENQMADALIHFLVRADLATSHAEQTEPNHYRYRISIDWPKLQSVAKDAGIDLNHALPHHSE